MDQELIEYLDRRFEAIDRRFEESDRRWNERFEEAKRYFGVRAEELQRHIQLVAEGVANVDEKLERFREETRSEFRETQAMIRFSHADLQDQIDNLKRRLIVVEERLGLRPS